MKNTKRKVIDYLLAGAVGLQFLLIFCCNYFKTIDMLDYDSAMAVRHAVDMWRGGTVFLKDFGYTTSMEIDCASFLAASIYILTGNYGLGISLAHLFLDGILACIIYRLLKNMRVSYEFCMLGVLLVFSPYKYGQLEWSNMLFLSVGQYEFRVISLLFLFLLLSYRDDFKKKNWIEYGVCQIFIFITVLSTGNYFIITALIPLLLYEILRILREEKFDWRNRNLNLVFWSIITALCAYGLRNGMGVVTNRSNMNILKDTEFVDNLWNCMTGVFALFGGLASYDLPVISAEGIACMVRFILVCILLGVGGVAVAKRDTLMENSEFPGRFLCVFLVNMLVFLFTNTRYGAEVFEVRYHMPWCILLILLDVMLLSGVWSGNGKWMRYAMAGCMAAGILIINASGFQTLWNVTDFDAAIEETSEGIADEYGIQDIVVMDGKIARKMAARNIDKNVQFGVVIENDGGIAFNTWGSTSDTSVAALNMLVIKDEDFAMLSPEISRAYYEITVQDGWHIMLTDHYSY